MTLLRCCYVLLIVSWSSVLFALDQSQKNSDASKASSGKKNQSKNSPASVQAKANLQNNPKNVMVKSAPSAKPAENAINLNSDVSAPSAVSLNGKKSETTVNQVSQTAIEKKPESPLKIDPSKVDEKKASDDELTSLNKLYDGSIKALIDQRCQGCHVERKSNMSDFNQVRLYAEKAYKNMKIGMMPPKPIPPEERRQILEFFDNLRKFSEI